MDDTMHVERPRGKKYDFFFPAVIFHFCINPTSHYTELSSSKSETRMGWKNGKCRLIICIRQKQDLEWKRRRTKKKKKKPVGGKIKKVWGEGDWRWFPGKWGHIWFSLLTNMQPGWGLFLGKSHRSHISLPRSLRCYLRVFLAVFRHRMQAICCRKV